MKLFKKRVDEAPAVGLHLRMGGGFFGVLGMFFGVPVFACLRMLVKWLMDRRLTRRGMPTEASAYVERKEALRQSHAAARADEGAEDKPE